MESDTVLKGMKEEIQTTMTKYVGIIRNEQGLMTAKEILKGIHLRFLDIEGFSLVKLEVANMLTVANLVIEAAIERKESRGAHFRSDFDKPDDINWKRNIVKALI